MVTIYGENKVIQRRRNNQKSKGEVPRKVHSLLFSSSMTNVLLVVFEDTIDSSVTESGGPVSQ